MYFSAYDLAFREALISSGNIQSDHSNSAATAAEIIADGHRPSDTNTHTEARELFYVTPAHGRANY